MARLLVVDPLDLELKDRKGKNVWSTRSCFERELGQLVDVSFEVVRGDDPNICSMAKEASGVILGGSEASACDDTAFNDNLLDLIAICLNNDIPMLAICYGSQLLGRALGSKVARHPEGIELGAPAIRLSAKGREHMLFKNVPNGCVWSVETHNDEVVTLPPDTELLASTAHTTVQAFSYKDLLFGVQFHPEMNADDLRFLWQAFLEKEIIDEVPDKYREIIDACECDTLPQVMQNFAEHVKSMIEVV